MVVGILLPVGIGVLQKPDIYGKNVLLAFCVIGIMFISIEEKIEEKSGSLVLIFLLLECVNAVFMAIVNNVLVDFKGNLAENISYLIVKCCTAISILLFNMVKDRIKYNENMHINSTVYLIIGIMACSMIFCLMFLNQVIDYLHYNNRYIIFCSILDIAILFSIFFLVVFVIYIKKTHERMEQLLRTEKLLKEAQVNYYNQALKKEIDTRKYRHDMINHLIYVQDILSRNKIEEAQRYLISILGGFKKIQNTYYVIGNEMVNTIMNYFFGMLPDDVLVDIKGKCPVKLDLEDTDICTIFSNLLQNAVEEITENNIENAHIIIEIYKGKQYVEYRIKNSLYSEIKENSSNNLPISHKYNKKNHGIGMLNVMNAIERNHGKFDWYKEDGYFCVSVVLPIINENL